MRTPAFLNVLAVLVLNAAAHAQSTAFTYQGRLKSGTTGASGVHDFRFRLWDAAAGGVQLGGTQCIDNLSVSEGLFTATIDFGQQFAASAQRFLEIEVRADTGLGCANVGGFVVLTPRQLLTAAPMASHAKSAFALDAPDGSPGNAVFVNNDGKVGIGTTAPSVPLQISSDLEAVMVLHDPGPTSTQAGYIGFWNSVPAETGWVGFGTPGSPHLSMSNARPGGDIELQSRTGGKVRLVTGVTALTASSGGSVGIGTETPLSKLDVRGDIRLGPSGQFFAPATEENLRLLRGTIQILGTVFAGSGWTVTHPSTGTYVVTFITPFAGIPTISASAGVAGFSVTQTPTTSGVTFVTRNPSGVNADSSISFIAAGPR